MDHRLLKAACDFLFVTRLEKVLVRPGYITFFFVGLRQKVGDLWSFVVCMGNDPLQQTLTPSRLTIVHRVLANLDEVVIHCRVFRHFLDVLCEVQL
jgi:hypothetical protein